MDGVDEPVLTHDHVRVRGDFDAPSRWLWLFKWCLLAAPHYPILILLYLAYPLVTVLAGVAILLPDAIRVRSSTSMSGCCAGRGES